jgi:predicted ATP-binding protein involved in virulence
MKITSVVLNNFRCFENFEIHFSETYNVHVILAENMAGKSALMQALRIGGNTYTSDLAGNQNYNIKQSDHRIIGKNPIANISLHAFVDITANIINETGKQETVNWVKYKEKPTGDRTKISIKAGKSPAKTAQNVYNKVIKGEGNLPLFNFIGTEYIHITAAETDKLAIDGDAIQGYRDCFHDKSIKKFLFDWLQRIDGILAEQARKKTVADIYADLPSKALFVFQQAASAILTDIKNVEWLNDKKQPIIEFQNGDIRLFEMLSDGYRYLILLAGELATRAVILNKHLPQETLLSTISGMVLIDEFGIHLHPSLQSEALTRLSSTFPNVQFIISTHSPLLVNGLKKEQIHLLELDADGTRTTRHPDEDAIGLGAEGILLNMFGLETTYDKISLAWKDEYISLFNQKNNGKLSQAAEKRFEYLSQQLAPYRLDPSLQVVQEDVITKLVREKIQERATKITIQTPEINNLSEQIDDILNDIFK